MNKFIYLLFILEGCRKISQVPTGFFYEEDLEEQDFEETPQKEFYEDLTKEVRQLLSPMKRVELLVKKQFKRIPKIEKEDLDLLLSAPDDIKTFYSFARFQIVDNKVYGSIHSGRRNEISSFLKSIARLSQKTKIPNVDFVIYFGDSIPSHEDEYWNEKFTKTPNFHTEVDVDNAAYERSILMPDYYVLSKEKSLIFQDVLKRSPSFPWEQRKNIIGWRGATTGTVFNLESFPSPRISLVSLSRSFPEIFDAKFTIFAQIEKSESGSQMYEIMETFFPRAPNMPEVDHMQFRYLISLDGNVSAWFRVPWILATKSTLLLQSKFLQWFYPALVPWEHYIPVDDNLENIFEIYEWLQKNQEKAQKIGEHAHDFAKEVFSEEAIDKTLFILFKEYEKKQNFVLNEKTLPEIAD